MEFCSRHANKIASLQQKCDSNNAKNLLKLEFKFTNSNLNFSTRQKSSKRAALRCCSFAPLYCKTRRNCLFAGNQNSIKFCNAITKQQPKIFVDCNFAICLLLASRKLRVHKFAGEYLRIWFFWFRAELASFAAKPSFGCVRRRLACSQLRASNKRAALRTQTARRKSEREAFCGCPFVCLALR